ncbi:ABC transporter permease [Catalinimonas niigatensis]|uniref:ABC transporter permease n=1 Tax=Catalinimonas niigatensis TaxID=1397264 RepID=UPI0026666D42|nr:ABC transporter permease [Catalinimonas niigatensis]WPP51066.1 FtsX-like permease family protein [Catalinimonas niigatensis]
MNLQIHPAHMLKNYFNTALRSLWRYKGYSVINLLGLVLGITSCILICLYVQSEMSYDRFHNQADQIYRIQNRFTPPFGNALYPHTVSALGPAIAQNSTEVKNFVRVTKFGGGFNNSLMVKIGDEFYKEENAYAADPAFFNIFSFPLLEGSPESVLKSPYNVVLSKSLALKFFGEGNALGKSIAFANHPNQDYKVSGIMADVPENTHMQFDLLISLSTIDALNPDAPQTQDEAWLNDGYYTYLLLENQDAVADIEESIRVLSDKHVDEQEISRFNASLMPLTDIYLHSNGLNEMKANGSMTRVYIFIAVAIFILLIAIINYMNLATARSARRAREVGMRKALGAFRRQLIFQFLSESLLTTFFATLVSLFLAYLFLPAFNNLAGKNIELDLFNNPLPLSLLSGILLFVGLASGSYPAFFLSSFRPVDVLKGELTAGMKSSPLLRKGLVIFQFAVSIVLIICTWIVYSQLDFLQNKDLGYDKEHIVVLTNTDNAVTERMNAFRAELMKNANISNVGASFSVPGGLRPIIAVKTDEMNETEREAMACINVNFEYIPTFDIELIEGRNFDPNISTDSTQAVILNQEGVKQLGITGNPIGQVVSVANFDGGYDEKTVIGVIGNINFEPLYRKTEGAFLAPLFPAYNYVFIKISPENRQNTIAHIEQTWKTFVPEQAFDFSFLNDELNRLYAAEEKMSTLVTYFSALAIIVACLGLFGLASFATDQRRKEIGVRKVLGASNRSIVLMFYKEYLQIILVSNLIAWPLAYYLARQWMGNFVFNTGIHWFIFLMGGGIVLVIALLTVGSKAAAAALSNPVNALRSE